MSLIVDIKKKLGSFELESKFEAQNGVTCLLGPSGCGKSMTLKCIAGIEKPDSGHIELDGVVLYDSEKGINLPPQKRHVGYLFQNYALFPNMTVRQNILCGMRHEKDKAVKEEKLKKMLDMFQLNGLENHRPAQLSGGQAQRTALARIMVSDPQLLLLDEPFSALDAHLRGKLMIEMRDVLARFGREVIMVTHNRDEAYNMSREIAVMDSGKLLTVKKTKELFADPGSVPAAILYFNPTTPTNRYEVEYCDDMEEPFEWIIEFRFKSAKAEAPSVWWRVTKDKRPQTFPTELGIAPANILLLY